MATPPDARPARLPLRRAVRGRWVAGVCQGLAAHLDVSVGLVRAVMGAAAFAAGAGVVLYGWLWVFVPLGDPATAAREQRPASAARIAPRLPQAAAGASVTGVVVGLLLLLAALLLVLWRLGIDPPNPWLLPLLVVLGGASLVWSQLDAHAVTGRGRLVRLLPVLGGLALAVVGVLLLLRPGRGVGDLLAGLAAGLAVMAGAAVVLAPLWLRLVRDLGVERAARAREAERADMAAHLHDSVLQSLSLIRSRARDAPEVARLARAQERDLRRWLYEDVPRAGTSLAEEVRETAAEVEDRFGVPVDVVAVGDVHPASVPAALVAATREALHNAVVHGRPPVSVYVEVGAGAVQVYVRDRGAGFDPAAVPEGRHGVRESILARLARHGGSATIRSGPGHAIAGTEIIMRTPLQEEDHG